MNNARNDAEVSGFGKTAYPRRQAGTRLNGSDDWRRKRARSATIIARPSKQSDRNESGCGTLLRRRGLASEEARAAAETSRTASEEARVATDDARPAVVDAVQATADALNASFEQMQVVEEMRRTLREIKA
jgi:hypothetical protein